jgi:outer membrane lipopolysaccharide assembly protein LptE/RlpB
MKNAAGALVALLLASCSYALVGTGSILDPSIKTLYVPAFVNRTTRVELEQRVTQSVADEFVSRGRVRLVTDPKQADIILRGSMDTFNLAPVGFEQGRATQYQISITANIELLDHRHDDKVLWKNDQYRFVENYQVTLETTDSFDQESRAITEIAQRFAQSLVANLLEGF